MRIIKVATCLTLIGFSTVGFANKLKINSPYIGVDILGGGVRFKNGNGGKLFAKSDFNYNLFAGVKFNDWLGSEIGFQHQPRKANDSSLGGGETPTGLQTLPNDGIGTYDTKISGKHPYIGIFSEYKLTNSFDTKVKLLIGASFSSIRAGHITIADEFGAFGEEDKADTKRTYTKNVISPMLRLSLSHYIFNPHIKLRYQVAWRGTSTNISANEISNRNQAKTKDLYNAGIGLVYSF